MGQAVVRGGFDTYASQARPSAEHYGSARLRLDSGAQRAFIYLKNPAPRGATVTSAVLRFHAAGSSSGSRTLTCSRISESWRQRRLNWNNQPGVITAGQVTTTVGALADGQPVAFDVTGHVQAVVDGGAAHGWRITTSATTSHRLYGLDAAVNKPTLEVTWSDAPSAPTTLVPADGVISLSHPVLACDYTDVSGATELAAIHAQVDPAANGATPAFDTGEVLTAVPQVDLSATAYPGLADGAATWWRVRVKDSDGLWSEWSDWTQITRHVKPAVTITNPSTTGPVVWDTTPPIIWSCPGQIAWQVRITPDGDITRLLYDSGKRTGADTSHTVPAGVLVDDMAYAVNVRCWDRADRVAAPADPTYASAWLGFGVDDDLATTPNDTLTAEVTPDTPWVRLTWTRATAPDSWTVLRDGRVIAAALDPADTLTSGTTHQWTDYTADPNRQHVYTVKPVVDGRQAQPGPPAAAITHPVGVWVADPERGVYAVLAGDDQGTWEMHDDATTYTPVGSTETVRVVTGMRGLEGQLAGMLVDGIAGRAFADQEADLYAIKEQPASPVRIVAGDVNIEAVIGDVTVTPTTRTRGDDVVKDVSLSFWQRGRLPFTPRL